MRRRNDVGQRGYSVVVWRGRHVADPTELSKDEANTYFDEVLHVARAIERRYKPIKMNFEMLDDGEPGHPPHFMRIDLQDEPKIPEEHYARDLAALRDLLQRV